MNKKPGRNDPCPCGSGKKYKQCCALKSPLAKLIKHAVWINAPKPKEEEKAAETDEMTPNLIERAFGTAVTATEEQPYTPKPFQASLNPPSKKSEE